MKKFLVVTLITILSGATVFYFLSSDRKSIPQDIKPSIEKMTNGEYDSAIILAKKILTFSKNDKNKFLALSIIGYSFYEKREADSSFHYYTKALSIKNINNTERANALNMVGVIFQHKQTHPSAIKYFQQAINLYETGNNKKLPIAYYNLAYSQSQTDNIACIDSYYKALEYASKFEDKRYEAYCLSDLGNLMLETSNYEAATEYFHESLDNEYTKNHVRSRAIALQGLGEAEYASKDYDSAKLHALEALKIKTERSYDDLLFTSYFLLGRIYRNTGDLNEAENNLKRAVIYYPHNERNKQAVNVFKELSDVQLQLGKIQQSEYHNQLHFEELERILDEKKKSYNMSKVTI
ncbi:tetratricopeptide repeat protein [Reichenbachiella agariperforans]|uniref:Tetratricopeptide repeat-containing protein n=1 Tax=Reichenbachiella agariperforans TaxID=156994 RepID=A0A1M6KLQ3_REIAG|nr:tetratricopeptide repeat protein [Reichenbachiella agariperforans]MBU2913604.1 tetratricopeptide repeat protein [Reichenbachiella agariperforans]SHJ59849.1 Tetratricopeptide repeat-containing protein [Reichenbachiella agariperforans]